MNKIDLVKVSLKEKSYNVIIGKNLLKRKRKEIFSTIYGAKRIFIITDNIIKKLHLKNFLKSIPNNFIVEIIIIKPGEKSKQLKTVTQILDFLLKKNISRTDAIFTLGGGVIGDISGFVASTVLRGVRLIHFPTTLLAQVDSSIGGKTGVNTIHGKNLVGTFYQPKLVVCDIDFLLTLPKREILSGYAEVIKYCILSDKEFFFWLKVKFNFDKIYKINDPNILQEVVKKSVFIKASLVTKDEKDVKNQRALLNFGHTYAHALEKCCNYSKKLLHGEAVSIGICMASRLSKILGFLPLYDCEEIKKLFIILGLPTDLYFVRNFQIRTDDMIKHMMYDKKVLNGKLNFILCKKIGKTFVYNKVDVNSIKKSINMSLTNL